MQESAAALSPAASLKPLTSPAGFVHLRMHTAYSLLEGAVKIKQLPAMCRAYEMPAIAITDSGNLFGALEFSETLAGEGVQPIIGCAMQLCFEEADPNAAVTLRGPALRDRIAPIVLLAQNEMGYVNLMRHSSNAFLDNEVEPHITCAQLAAHNEGLICLTGGALGPVGCLLRHGRRDAAGTLLRDLAEIFPQRLYLELQRHGMAEEVATEADFIRFAYDQALPLVATNEVYFPYRDMYEAHDALICIAAGAYVSQDDRRKLTPEHYLKSPAEMAVLFTDLPEAIENTIEIARRCAYRPRTRAPILPRIGAAEEEAAELRRQAMAGLDLRLAKEGRFAGEEAYRQRLAFELDVIIKMGFAGYFLIVADFIQWAKGQGIPVGPGRGSGAGSCVAWALTITDLDPLRFGLLFERFLNPERVSMPDFDIDFCQERRDEVIHYVREKYGHDRVAQIIAIGKLQARAALRDVGRVLQMPYGQVDRLCKMVPNNPANPVTLAEAIKAEPRLKEERDSDPMVARLLDTAMRVEGLYRHASVHAAGVVIGDRPLQELVPLYREPRGEMPVTQFNMKWVEPAGLVKFDFLGLKTLTVIARTVELLARRGVSLDIHNIPLDDAPSFAMLREAETVGLFQLEGSGMRESIRSLRPDRFEDIIAMVALYRPGPMDDIPKYIACKNGQEEVVYPHPMLEPILSETYGVIVYQEQVMQIAQVLSGYSLGEADLLRRAMGKKIQSEMDAQRARFINGAIERGVDAVVARNIFELVNKFAGYGFNKCHSAPYAMIAYQTAYLKANYPVEFLAASMMLDQGNTDKLSVFRKEAARLGISVNAPDINRSEADFCVVDGAIYYALGAVRNVGAQAMRAVVLERDANGPFADMEDFIHRVDPRLLNKRSFEFLVRAGAFDTLSPNRARLLASADSVLALCNAAANARSSRQTDLFASGGVQQRLELKLPPADPWPPIEKLKAEFDALGFYLSAHPLDDYAAILGRANVTSYAEFFERIDDSERPAKLAGAIVGKREQRSQRGNPFAFVTLSDQSGEYEVTFFSELLSAHRELLETGNLVVMNVTGRLDRDRPRLTAQSIQAVDRLSDTMQGGLRVFVSDATPLAGLQQRLESAGQGRGYVNLVLRGGESRAEVEIRIPGSYAVGPRVRGALAAISGVLEVQEC
ncbi:MAG: DNA polymerase III subunit alpha [Alphaproteobacteria bacterium]|nr:DNA polymerase III subunit alpha [Alphaproteobacteria bacterium]